MDHPRPMPVADVASIAKRRISPQLNPLEEYCFECGRAEEKEFENILQHSPLTDAPAFAEVSRRAAARRNNPMSYKHLISRPTLPNEAFPWSYADWQVAGDPGNAHLMQEWVYAKWPEWEPMDSSMVQYLPPLKCSKCDVGSQKLRRRQEDMIIANMHSHGVISPESAPELSSTYEKHYDQPPAVQSSMLHRRYPKKSLKDGNREMRDVFPQNRRVRKGTKSHSIPIDESTTDTEAAMDGRAAPQMKGRQQHSAAARLQPEAMREAKQRPIERSGRTRPSNGTDRRQAEVQRQNVQGDGKNEDPLRNSRGAANGEFESVAHIAEEFEKRSHWLSQAQLDTLHRAQKYVKNMVKASATASSGENAKGLGVIAESVTEERPKTSASKKRTLNVAPKSKSEEKPTTEVPKAPAPWPPSPLMLDHEQFRLQLPLGPVSIEDVPEDDADDKRYHQETGQTCSAVIDSILAEKGLASVTEISDRPYPSPKIDSHEEKPNESKVAKSTEEAKVSGTETRVVTPNEGSPPNSPNSTFAQGDSEVKENDVEKCIAMLSQMSVKERNKISSVKDVAAESKVDRDDISDIKLKVVSELTEQLVQSSTNSISAKNDVVYSTADTSVVSTAFSLGNSSTTQHLMGESESESRVSEASKSISSRKDSRREISDVVRKQVKYVKFGLGQLEKLISIQSNMMDESTESKQSNSGLA